MTRYLQLTFHVNFLVYFFSVLRLSDCYFKPTNVHICIISVDENVVNIHKTHTIMNYLHVCMSEMQEKLRLTDFFKPINF